MFVASVFILANRITTASKSLIFLLLTLMGPIIENSKHLNHE